MQQHAVLVCLAVPKPRLVMHTGAQPRHHALQLARVFAAAHSGSMCRYSCSWQAWMVHEMDSQALVTTAGMLQQADGHGIEHLSYACSAGDCSPQLTGWHALQVVVTISRGRVVYANERLVVQNFTARCAAAGRWPVLVCCALFVTLRCAVPWAALRCALGLLPRLVGFCMWYGCELPLLMRAGGMAFTVTVHGTHRCWPWVCSCGWLCASAPSLLLALVCKVTM